MKRTLNVVLAVVLAFAMIASFAYVATPEKSNEYQLSLVSAKAVNVQDTTQGIRSYADLVDASRIYQVNEVIYLAITSEVKNLEKYPKLKSIEDKDIKVYVGSPSIDLSYSKLTTPTLLANVWSGYTATDVATVGYLATAGTMLEYDKDTNEVSWTFRGVPLYGMGGSSSHASAGMNLVTFDPYFDTANKKIHIPAIKLKDKTTTWTLGGSNFDTKFEAPTAIGYTMVLTGVTKDNAGAQKGTFYAKIQISGAEKFEDHGTYYQKADGLASYTDTKPTTGREWLDWVEIDVDKLEISGGYTVYKYFMPSSALMYDTAFFYNGNDSTLNGNTDTKDWVDNGAVVAHVNPELFDNATNKTDKINNTLTAGGVKTVKAYATFKDGENNAAMKDFPLTSIVYSNSKAYYAPGFYGGTIQWGGNAVDPNGGTQSTERVAGWESTGTATETVKVVEYFDLSFVKDSNAHKTFNARDIIVLWSDTTPGTTGFSSLYADSGNPTAPATWSAADVAAMYDLLAANSTSTIPTTPPYSQSLNVTDVMQDPNGNVNYSPVQGGDGNYIVRLYPSATNTLNVTPLNKSSKETGYTDNGIYTQSMLVYYRNPNYTVSSPASGFTGPNRTQPTNETFIHPMSTNGATNPYYCPVFKEHTKEVTVQIATTGMSFEAVEQNWLKPVTNLTTTAQITDVRASMSFSWRTTEPAASAVAATGVTRQYDLDGLTFVAKDGGQSELKIPIYDLRSGLPTNVVGKTGLKNGNDALDANEGGVGSNGDTPPETFGAATSTFASWYIAHVKNPANTVLATGATGAGNANIFVYGFKSLKVVQVGGAPQVVLSGLVRWDPVLEKWENCTFDDFTTLPTQDFMSNKLAPAQAALAANYQIDPTTVSLGGLPAIDLVGTGSSSAFRANMTAKADFTFYKDAGQEADEFYYKYDSSTAAAYSLWEGGAAEIVEGHNGITAYSICSYDDERPYVTMVTETAYYDSDDGYGIALYDGYNLKFGGNTMAKRIYRTNASNLAYSEGAEHVPDSAKIISALSFFGLDTSFDTTFRVQKEVFESKGAAAVFSEAIEGEFNYGTISIIADTVDEGTEDEEIEIDDPTDEGDDPEPDDTLPDDDGDVDDGEGEDFDPPEEPEDPEEPEEPYEPVEPKPAPVVPPTGDVSSSIAVSMVLAAVVAGAALVFAMKKAR